MMQRPWDCAQPEEWLPRSLRLCWGGSSGGFSGDSGGGGWSGDGGFASTGGGDWGSSGSFDASGFNAGGDLGAWAGTAYDASTAGTGAGAGGDWGSFAATNYSGMNAPNPTFADVAGPNPGVTTGGGDWGSAGTFSAAGTGGGPLGAMFGADTGGGSMYGGGGGGGLFGDYGGGGGGGAYTGGGGGGRSGGDAFGSFGTLAASNTGRGSEAPSPAAFTDTAGGGRLSGDAPASRSDAPTRSEAEVSSVSEADQAAPEAAPDEAAAGRGIGSDEVASPSDFGTPSETSAPEASTAPSRSQADPSPSLSLSDAAPSGWIGGEPDAAAPSQSAFGPQTVTHSEDQPTDYQGSPYADMGPQGDTWGSVFEGAAPTQAVEPGAEQYGTQAMDFAPQGELGSRSFFNAPFWNAEPAWAQNAPTVSEALQPGGPLSALGRGYDFLSNLPSTLSNALNPSVPTMLQAPSTMDLQALGEQGKAGQPDATDWGSVFAAPDQAPDYASVFEGTPSSPDWGSVFEGAPSNEPDWASVFEGAAPTEPAWSQVFEGADPTVASPYDTTMESGPPGEQPSTDNAATPGSDPALSGAAAADAAQNAGASPQAADAASRAAAEAAQNGGTPTEQATAAMAAALEAGATQAQADAIAGAVYDAATSSQAPSVVSRGAFETLSKGQELPAINLPVSQPFENPDVGPATSVVAPDTTPWGSVFEGAAPAPSTPAQQQQSVPGPELTSEATGTQSAIPGGRTTDFNYGPQAAPPSLVDMAQPGRPGGIGSDYAGGGPGAPLAPPSQSALPPADQPVSPEQHGEGNPGGEGNPDQPSTVPATPLAPPEPGGVTAADRAARGPNAQPEPQHVQDARRYLLSTANPGDTMNRQGPDVAIARLEPNFAVRLAAAIREARANGLPNASVFSAFRSPAFGANPGYAAVSQHGRGIAVDMSGIGRPGSREAQLWYQIATRNGLYNPYGPNHRAEWNHYQAVPQTGRQTADRLGPNPRNPPASMVPTWGQVGVRPVAPPQEAQLPGGARGIGSDRSDIAWTQQPDVARPPADIPPAAALPPQDPAPRPQADIPIAIPAPAPFMTPPGRGRADARWQAERANSILKQATAHLNKQSGEADFQAASKVAASGLAAAGVPLAMARSLMTKGAYEGAEAVGYGPSSMGWNAIYKSRIDGGIEAALQGYNPGATGPTPQGGHYGPGPVQGPYGFQPDAPAAPAAPGKQGSLFDLLNMFNPISTAEAKGRGRDIALERAIGLAREGGNFGGQPGMSVVGSKVFTFYAPGASGPKGMEGPMVGSRGNPLTTLDDVRNGAGFVSLAGHPNQFGQQVFIGDITYTSPVDGKQYTLNNVIGRVDDTGSKFGGKDNPDKNHFDIAVGDFSSGWNDSTAGRFVASNYATAVPGRGIGADYATAPWGDFPAVGAQPAQEAPPRGLAKGGHVAKDEKVVVGEEGPEYFVPDRPGTVVPHMPQPGGPGNIDRWPKVPAVEYPGQYGGVEREMRRRLRAAQDPVPGLMDMINSGQLRFNPDAWDRWLNDPKDVALGRSRIEDRRAYAHDYPY